MAFISIDNSSSSGRTISIAVAAISISIVAAAIYLRRRRRRAAATERETAASPCCSKELEAKPQYGFKRVLADNSFGPFSHYKTEGGETGVSLKLHPYWDSISSLLENLPTFPELITSHACPNMCSSFVWVDTLKQLELLAEILRRERVFAVDTEQHSVRSFLGFTALMQISTQKEDFLVDTIALHDMMDILRPIFADPDILKVFHGADNDILWLQRDFHIYVVNLFDTAKACGVLSKPHKSLAYLLETYCGVITNKLLQREDWRMRPLTAEMVNYARTDAHYLLFIASCLALELKSQTSGFGDDGMHEACRRSNTMCLQLYAKEKELSPGDSAAASVFSRYCTTQESSLKNDQIQELIRRLCTWRDLMARIHDESLRYVLSDQAIASLSIKVPNGPTGICNIIQQADADKDTFSLYPLFSPSPIVEGHMKDLCCIIQELTENADDVFRRIFQRYLDQKKNCPLSIYNYGLISDFNIKLAKTLFPIQNGGKHDGPLGRKASRQLFVQKFSCKSPVYHNCRIFSSDGRLLCYCDRKKLEWYLRRDLAKLIEDDPPAIMLLFEPKGGPEDEDNEFYIHSKKNICVGCGEKNHYLRYRIIPSCYRMHFPEHLKSHRSHDVVLLCVDCHEIAHSAAEKYKKQVAAEFGIPLFVKKVSESRENEVMTVASNNADKGDEDSGVSPLQLRTAAMALVRHGSRMPPNRQEELKEIIRSYFGGREISEDDLETALLVGMSAAERRRLERKRGLPFKSSGMHAVCTINESVIEEVSESSVDLSNNVYSSYESTFENQTKKCSKKGANNDNEKDDIDLMSYPGLVVDSLEVRQTLLPQQSIVESSVYSTSEYRTCFSNEDKSALCQKSVSDISVYHASVEHVTFEKSNIVEACSCITKTAICNCGVTVNDHESDVPSCENGGSSVSYRSVSRKYSKKVSLLGHGPHGKQVVDRLLEEKGGDGILQFSQKWRQIFVDSIHPRFLPAGWDIMHSGRRKFGKYSIYNPNRASDVEEE